MHFLSNNIGSTSNLSSISTPQLIQHINGNNQHSNDINPTANVNHSPTSYHPDIHQEPVEASKSPTTIPKIQQSDIAELERDNFRPADEAGVKTITAESGETFIFDPERGYQHVNVKHSSPDLIDIDPQLKNKYKFFQLGDTVYDRDGYFLYRIPGLD